MLKSAISDLQKDVPVEFYWDNTWKKLEKRVFGFKLRVFDGQNERPGGAVECVRSFVRSLFIFLNFFV